MENFDLKETGKVKILYLGVFLLLGVAAFSLLSAPVGMIFHETDFYWMVPSLSHISHHNSFWETIKVLFFNPAPTNYGEPTMNLYLFLILHFFGSKVQYFVFMSTILHFCCAFFLFRLLKRIGFSFQTAFLSVLIYAFSFFHSLYFLWPMATQHLAVMFFTLLIFYLFLETNYRLEQGLPWKTVFWQALLVNVLASFCQVAIFVLPLSIFIYILCCSGDCKARTKRFDLWLPLFITYLGHPLIRSIFWGYPHLDRYLGIFKKILSRSPFFSRLTLNVGSEINPFISYLLFFAAGIAFLFLLRFFLKKSLKPSSLIILKRIIFSGAVLYLISFLLIWRCRGIIVHKGLGVPLPDFISPYNFIRPLVAVFISFLNPIRTVLSMDAVKPYYYIPMSGGIAGTVFFMLLLVIFFKKVYFNYKPLVLFVIIYILALRSITQISLWEMKNSIPSRYLVYITPLFAVIFASSLRLMYNFFMNKVKITVFKKELILVIFFFAICLSNILAVRFAFAKNKLVNEFEAYDYIKGASLIKHNLDDTGGGARLKDICVRGVLPMPLREYGCDFFPGNPLDLDTFKYTMAQVFNERDASNLCVGNSGEANKNEAPRDETRGLLDDYAFVERNPAHRASIPGLKVGDLPWRDKKIYIFDKTGVTDQNGQTIDPFLKKLYEAKKELKSGNYQQARVLFEEAVKIGPFFFQFILPSRPLEDILWMANNRSAYTLANDIGNLYRGWASSPVNKIEYIINMLNGEIKDYAECFFYLSYLSYREKNIPQSRYWYSRIRFIDDRNDEVLSFLKQQPLVKADFPMQEYINEIKNNPSYNRKVDLKFSSMGIIFKLFSKKNEQ